MKLNMRKGFSLVELIITIVLLGIVSGLGIGLALNVFSGYAETKVKNFLLYEAKFTIERLDRELRNAIPNSVKTGDSGEYIQYVLLENGIYYESQTSKKIKVFQRNFSNLAKVGDKISIYILNPNEISKKLYEIENIEEISQDNWSISLNNTIKKNSPFHRAFIVKNPVTIYKNNNKLIRCFGYDISSSNGVGDGTCNVLTNYVKKISFQFNPGTGQNCSIVKIDLVLEKNEFTLEYKHEVHLRNVP